MVQALGIVKEIAGNQVIARSLGEVEVGVREGAGVAEPLARSGVFPPLAIQMISVGEETGKLDEMLLKVAELLRPRGARPHPAVHAAARAGADPGHGARPSASS